MERLRAAALPSRSAEIWLIDRVGVLGTLYEWVQVAFIGGSGCPLGGHNPFEPLRHGVSAGHKGRIWESSAARQID
ncbi:MAG: hypothetical protein R3C97_15190 [Geminicoccaceae bacterium]